MREALPAGARAEHSNLFGLDLFTTTITLESIILENEETINISKLKTLQRAQEKMPERVHSWYQEVSHSERVWQISNREWEGEKTPQKNEAIQQDL